MDYNADGPDLPINKIYICGLIITFPFASVAGSLGHLRSRKLFKCYEDCTWRLGISAAFPPHVAAETRGCGRLKAGHTGTLTKAPTPVALYESNQNQSRCHHRLFLDNPEGSVVDV